MRIPNTQRDEKTNFNMSDTGDRTRNLDLTKEDEGNVEPRASCRKFQPNTILERDVSTVVAKGISGKGLGSSSSMNSFASWKMNDSGIEKKERERRRHFKEKMSLEEVHHHRKPWIRAWRKKKMNEGRGREEHELLCSKRALKSEV
ncbi:hypothetical protein HKD37_08G022937 [Glycine soja]